MLVHAVFFSLQDNSAAARDQLIAACQRHLSDHPGTLFFATTVRTPDLQRDVNDQDFDVSLLLAFQTREDHDRYQTSERHLQFIAENKDNWRQVRVFDSDANA